jgi:hypothetical protein
MWLFTETGFVSAVCSPEDKDIMKVRARDKKSLLELSDLAGVDILEWDNCDYPYRVIVSKAVLSGWMLDMIDRADYGNFKSQVQRTRGYEYSQPLHEVWASMHDVTDTDDAKKRSLYYYAT